MPRSQLRPDLPTEEIAARYQGGESLNRLARAYVTTTTTIRNRIESAGVPIRSVAEWGAVWGNQLRQKHDSPLWIISAARWQEGYWGEERPSLQRLAARLRETLEIRCCVQHLRDVLVSHGIAIRSPEEQLKIDGAAGRHQYGRVKIDTLDPLSARILRWRFGSGARGKPRPRTRAHNAKLGLAHRKTETRHCRWCGAPSTRRPSEFRVEPRLTCCSVSCSNRFRNWQREKPLGVDTPRPEIVRRITQLFDGSRLAPIRFRDIEQIGAGLGAEPAEVREAFVRLGGKEWDMPHE